MKKLLFFFSVVLSAAAVTAQAPQKFSYQAVIRNSSNQLISSQQVGIKVSIVQGTPAGAVVYSETHTPSTDAYGLVTVAIGGGSVLSGEFAAINWGSGPYFIKTETDPAGGTNYTISGTSELISVPYAIAANKLTGSADKLLVEGKTSDPEEPLFEVRNKDGKTVFAVYNEGVRIYVDDGSKGSKGGFAIGGFSTAKAPSQDLFIVNTDSIRAYIDTNPDGKGKKAGFAIGGFDEAKELREEYLRVTRDSTRVWLNEAGTKASKGGFAIGGFNSAKGGSDNYFYVDPDTVSIKSVLAVQSNLVVSGNVDVSGALNQDPTYTSDADGNKYLTVKLGPQTWMAENLRTTKYSNGDKIPTTGAPLQDISGETDPKYQWAYDGNETFVPLYGRLYTWNAIMDGRNVCPIGWHIPTEIEFMQLFAYLEQNGFGYEGSGSDIGKAIASQSFWNLDSTPGAVGNDLPGNNSSGLNLTPGGFRESFGMFMGINNQAGIWTATEYETNGANYVRLDNTSDTPFMDFFMKSMGFSVRCVKNPN